MDGKKKVADSKISGYVWTGPETLANESLAKRPDTVVAQIQTSLNSCDRSQRQNSVAATEIFTCHTRRFVAATCRGDVSRRFLVSCVSALRLKPRHDVTLSSLARPGR